MKSVQRFSSVGNLSKRLNSGSWIEWWPQSDDDDDVWRLVLHHHWFISLTTAIECEIAPLLLSVCFIDSNVDLLLLCYCKTIQETFLWPQICPSGPVGHSNVFPLQHFWCATLPEHFLGRSISSSFGWHKKKIPFTSTGFRYFGVIFAWADTAGLHSGNFGELMKTWMRM